MAAPPSLPRFVPSAPPAGPPRAAPTIPPTVEPAEPKKLPALLARKARAGATAFALGAATRFTGARTAARFFGATAARGIRDTRPYIFLKIENICSLRTLCDIVATPRLVWVTSDPGRGLRLRRRYGCLTLRAGGHRINFFLRDSAGSAAPGSTNRRLRSINFIKRDSARSATPGSSPMTAGLARN